MAVSNAAKAAIGAAGITAGAVAVILLAGRAAAKQPPPSGQAPATLTLVAAQGTIAAGAADALTATVYDQAGNPIQGQSVTLLDETTGTTAAATTDSNGRAAFSVSFTSPGTYTLMAESG